MSDVVLGTLPESNASRDAIHVAVIPVIAGEMLRPGQRVGVKDGIAKPSDKVHGIVDPYLTDVVPKDASFWLCLLPGTVMGMRHHWLHDDFVCKVETDSDRHKAKAIEIAKMCDKSYDELMDDARTYEQAGEYIYDNSEAYKHVTSEDWEAFWKHYNEVEGRESTESWAPYTCSC